MRFSDELNACAALVEKGDPWRFKTVMAAPLAVRAKLFPLYAFNVEVSRAPYVTAEPMIAEMRLQWWRDALDEIAHGGNGVRRHEVVTPLAQLLSPAQAGQLDTLVAARRWDCYKDPFEDEAALETYLKNTAGGVMRIASGLLGGPDLAASSAGFGAGVAAWLRAIPGLEAAHRIPLLDGTPEGVKNLAQKGLDAWSKARNSRVPRVARPAFWPASTAARALSAAVKNPSLVANGALPEPGGPVFALKAMIGHW